jgi:NADH-quinone oxidoreductase subunit F
VRHFRHEFEYHIQYPNKVKDPKHFEKEPMVREIALA